MKVVGCVWLDGTVHDDQLPPMTPVIQIIYSALGEPWSQHYIWRCSCGSSGTHLIYRQTVEALARGHMETKHGSHIPMEHTSGVCERCEWDIFRYGNTCWNSKTLKHLPVQDLVFSGTLRI